RGGRAGARSSRGAGGAPQIGALGTREPAWPASKRRNSSSRLRVCCACDGFLGTRGGLRDSKPYPARLRAERAAIGCAAALGAPASVGWTAPQPLQRAPPRFLPKALLFGLLADTAWLPALIVALQGGARACLSIPG